MTKTQMVKRRIYINLFQLRLKHKKYLALKQLIHMMIMQGQVHNLFRSAWMHLLPNS